MCNGTVNKPHCDCAAWIFFFTKFFMALYLCDSINGIGAGSIDTALNNYVVLHYNSMQVNFLHCFYGVGVTVSPYLMSLALSDNMNWRGGYKTVFFIQLTIAALSIISLPIWKMGKSGKFTRENYSGIVFVTDAEAKKGLGILWHIHWNQCFGIHLLDLGKYIFIRKRGNTCRYCGCPDYLLFYRYDFKSAFIWSAYHKIF